MSTYDDVFAHSGPTGVVPVNLLVAADSPRSAGTDPAHINRLMQSEDELPPILVHRPTMRVIDGMHRLAAAARKGLEEIPVIFFDGSEAEALLLSISENVRHGLPLSLADRKAAAQRVLTSRPDLSDRAIAVITGLAAKTVKAIRENLAGGNQQLGERIGRDGRTRTVNSAEKRNHVARLLTQRPTASLRDIASEAGVSAATVLRVRNQLRDDNARNDNSTVPGENVHLSNDTTRAGEIQSILDRLRRDPAVRMTEAGRDFLRWLERHVITAKELPTDFSWLPGYQLTQLAVLARGCANFWADLAVFLESQLLRDKN